MKKVIFLILFTIFSFAQEVVNKDSSQKLDSEFVNKQQEVFDPLSGYNRLMTTFNDKVYINVLNPIARSYGNNVPLIARTGIDNFFTNLMFPVRFINNVLQLKFKNSVDETRLFLANTFLGFAGFVNFSQELEIDVPKEDFGQTLGFYGVGEGIPIVLPILGQSNLRDTVGMVGNSYVSVLSTTGSSDLQYKIPNTMVEEIGIETYNMINLTSLEPDQYETIKKDAPDLYPFLRDMYSQARKKQIEE